jgi:hypothetical protein
MKLRSIIVSLLIGISAGTTVAKELSFSQQLYQAPLDKPFIAKDFKDASWRYNFERAFFDATLPLRYLFNIFNKEKLKRVDAYNDDNDAFMPFTIYTALWGSIVITHIKALQRSLVSGLIH